MILGAEASGSRFDGLWSDEGLEWVISLSGGWRGVGRNQQLYFTPKLWRMHGFRIHS